MRKKKKHNYQSGQTLITLLIFIVLAVMVTSAAVATIIANTQSTTALHLGESAYAIAESGAENAILRVLRDRSYTGETVNINGGTAVITVSGTSPIDITVVGNYQNYIRTIQAQAQFNQGVLEVTTWDEQ